MSIDGLPRPLAPPPLADGPRAEAARYPEAPLGTRIAWSGRDGQFTSGGDKLKSLQNDLFHGGYYQSRSWDKEVDGEFGPRTQSAVMRLQEDLGAAGLYSGTPNGAFDPLLAQALARLGALGPLPDGLDARAAQRLSAFRASSGKPIRA